MHFTAVYTTFYHELELFLRPYASFSANSFRAQRYGLYQSSIQRNETTETTPCLVSREKPISHELRSDGNDIG